MTALSEERSHYRYERAQHRRRSSIQKIQNSSAFWTDPFFIVALSMGLMTAVAFFAAMLHMTHGVVDAFQPYAIQQLHPIHGQPSATRIFLEDWVAEMIDNELYRQEHHKEYEEAWMEKNKGAILSRLSDSGESTSAYPSIMLGDEDRTAFVEHRRDERMAFLKPEQYCKDRCVATGNCDILEDFYELGPEDVLQFCEECVLSDDDHGGECDVPEAFYDKEPPLRP